MTALLPRLGLAYVSVPKIACTSLKALCFEIENGFAFRDFRLQGRLYHVHDMYVSRPFEALPRDRLAGLERYALLRDPVARLLSSYANRVRHHRELGEAHLTAEARREGALPDPDLATFIDRLEVYRRHSPSIAHHTDPMTVYLGREPGFYTRLFPLDRVGDFVALLSERAGWALDLPRLQTGGPRIRPDDVTAAQRARLEAFYEEDWRVFGAALAGGAVAG